MSLPVKAVVIGEKDWMAVQPTNSLSWGNFNEIFDTTTGQCDVSDCKLVSQFGEEVDFTGYTWASNYDVNEMWKNYTGLAGLTSLTTEGIVSVPNTNIAAELIHALGGSTESSGDASFLYGLTRESVAGTSDRAYQFSITDYGQSIPDIFHDDSFSLISQCNFCTGSELGGWFYKTIEVSEPSTLLLYLVTLIGLSTIRNRTHNS